MVFSSKSFTGIPDQEDLERAETTDWFGVRIPTIELQAGIAAYTAFSEFMAEQQDGIAVSWDDMISNRGGETLAAAWIDAAAAAAKVHGKRGRPT